MNTNTKQLFNFFINTLGIKREDIKEAILQGAREEGKKHAHRLLQQDTNILQAAVQAAIKDVNSSFNNRYSSNSLAEIIKKEIAEQVAKMVEVKIK